MRPAPIIRQLTERGAGISGTGRLVGGGTSAAPAGTKPRRLVARAAPGGGGPGPGWGDRQQRRQDNAIVLGVGVGLTILVLLALRLGAPALQGGDAFSPWELGELSFGPGDALGGLLWGASLYFASPLQLLLLFFGVFEAERPSDGLLRRLGLAAGLPVNAADYRAPAWLRAAAAAAFGAGGLAVAAALQALLGDATWSVSTGLGACFGAAMYEVGRPRRLSAEEAQARESTWQDFARFADARLQRSGRCHDSDLLRALGRELPRYRGANAPDAALLRQLVKNWAPEAERSSQGFWRGVSLAGSGGSSAAPAGSERPAAGSSSSSGSTSIDSSTDQY